MAAQGATYTCIILNTKQHVLTLGPNVGPMSFSRSRFPRMRSGHIRLCWGFDQYRAAHPSTTAR